LADDASGAAQEAYERWAEMVRTVMESDVPRKPLAAAAGVSLARLYQL
jgi:hypothetical protein